MGHLVQFAKSLHDLEQNRIFQFQMGFEFAESFFDDTARRLHRIGFLVVAGGLGVDLGWSMPASARRWLA